MLDDELIKLVKKRALKELPAIANVLTGGLVDEARRALLANGTSRLAAAWENERDEVLWAIVSTLGEVASAVHGARLTPDQAMNALVRLAANRDTRRRLAALFREASTSTDERIAMLAVGYFVGAAETSLQERLDWALRSLFPDDADALGDIVSMKRDLHNLSHELAAREPLSTPDAPWTLTVTRIRSVTVPPTVPDRHVAAESVRALATARCIDLETTMPTHHHRDHVVRLIPLGRLLHENLSKVDWREIARRRRDTPPIPTTHQPTEMDVARAAKILKKRREPR